MDSFVLVVDIAHHNGGILVDNGVLALGIPFVAQRNGSSVPKALVGAGVHDGRDTLGGQLALEFGEYEDDAQHGFADGARRVELLVLGDERAVEFLQLLIHGGKVKKIAADAVNFPNAEVRKFPGADPAHHVLIRRAVRIFAGVASVLENGVVINAESVFRVVYQFVALEW